MSSLYNKDYIKTISEKHMIDILEGKKDYNIDSNNIRDRHFYIVFQHYLIKYIEEHGKTPSVNKYLGKYYDDFLNNPELFVDSPLLKTDFLNRFVPRETRNKIIDYRDKYYNSNSCKSLYDKSLQTELNDKEKDRLYSFLILNLNNKNENFEKVYEECAKKILNSGKLIKDLNDTELKFYCSYIASKTGDDLKVSPQVHIREDEHNIGGYQTNNLIFMNKYSNFAPTIYEITQTVCHETRHAYQLKESKDSNNRRAYEYAKYELFRKYLNTSDYSSYDKNYDYSDIEIDAEEYGFFMGRVLLSGLGRKDLSDKLLEIKNKRLNKRKFYEYMVDSTGQKMTVDKFNVENLDKIIQSNPEELENYKVLNNFYNKDGSKKKFSQLITRRMRQNFEEREIYDNYINYGIAHDELDNLNLERCSVADHRELFKALSSIYRDKILTFKDYCKDTDSSKSKGQMQYTTAYQLHLIDKMITYIDKNMDYVLSSKDESKISNRSFIFNFIIDLRDFDINSIKNEAIKNNPSLTDKIDEILDKTQSVIKKFNRVYIEDRIKDISVEDLHKTIKSDEGVDITLSDYLFFDLLPRLNGHMELETDKGNIYVGKIIDYYKNSVKNKNQNDDNITR